MYDVMTLAAAVRLMPIEMNSCVTDVVAIPSNKISSWATTTIRTVLILAIEAARAQRPRCRHRPSVAAGYPHLRSVRFDQGTASELGLLFTLFSALDGVERDRTVVSPNAARARRNRARARLHRERLNGEDGLGAIYTDDGNTVMVYDARQGRRLSARAWPARRGIDKLS